MPAIIALGLAAAIAIDIPNSSGRLAIHCIEPSRPPRAAALFVHGATFPTKLASGYEFSPNDSWLAFVAAQGYLACGLDFVGFGASSRPAAMLEAADRGAPVLRAPEAAEQIVLAVSYLRGKRGLSTVHVVAHSWGHSARRRIRGRAFPPRSVHSRCSDPSFPRRERPSRLRSVARGTR